VELALAALSRGEFRFSDARLEGAAISLPLDEAGVIRMPERSGTGIPAGASLDRLTISRSTMIWREAGKPAVMLSPIAAEMSAVSLAGPWRFEGEVAGASLRVTTGEMEADGRLRTKAYLTGEDLQLGFDGALLFPKGVEGVGAELDGAFNLSPGGAVALTGRVKGGSQKLDLSGLMLDLAGGAARLEGDGQYLPGTGKGSLARGRAGSMPSSPSTAPAASPRPMTSKRSNWCSRAWPTGRTIAGRKCHAGSAAKASSSTATSIICAPSGATGTS